MTHSVGEAYDAVAEVYASRFLHELDDDHQSQRWLPLFASAATVQRQPVLDLGCGPGSTANHLRALGIAAVGIDISVGQLVQARHAYPELAFAIGDLTDLPVADESVGGIVARHSIIHLPPTELQTTFEAWGRALAINAPVFISFFGSRSADAHGSPFDHKVTTAYELFPARVGELLGVAGFGDLEIEAAPIASGGRPFDHSTIVARKDGRAKQLSL